MRRHKWLTAGVGVALMLTTAASTTYAESDQYGGNHNDQSDHGTPWWCQYIPPSWSWPGCGGGGNPDPHGPPSPSATPELDSLLLFGVGLSGLGGYAMTRYRARRR
jgi:hypothetical protein